MDQTNKNTNFQITWISSLQCCFIILKWHQCFLTFDLLCKFGPINIHGSQPSKYLTHDMNLVKKNSYFFSWYSTIAIHDIFSIALIPQETKINSFKNPGCVHF